MFDWYVQVGITGTFLSIGEHVRQYALRPSLLAWLLIFGHGADALIQVLMENMQKTPIFDDRIHRFL